MAAPGERFKGWIDSLATAWKDRLRGWMASWLSFGIETMLDVIGKRMAPTVRPLIDKIEANTEVPPELKPIFDELKEPKGEIAAFFATQATNGLVGGALGLITDWVLRSFLTGLSYQKDFYLQGAPVLLTLYLRHVITKDQLYFYMREHGAPPEAVDELLIAAQLRFPSEIVGPLWLRDKDKYGKYWDDVTQLGIDPERLAALMEMTFKIPGVQDIIRYVVKEAYSPEIYKAFGQDQEYPAVAEADAHKAGVRPDMLLKEWIAHWDLPSVGNGFEMLHRGEITQGELALLLKARDIMPFWRDKLTAISWSIPTRIEVRMMAQLGLVDKQFIMDILKADGLAEEYRSVVADMNIVRGIRSDLQTRYTKKWLDSAGVKAEIDKSGLSPEIGERLYQWIVSNAKPERTAPEKDLTAAEIVKGVKKGVIDWNDGISRLMVLGYDEEEATFRMAIDVEVTEAAPTTELNTRVDTIRRQRRQRLITRDEELSAFLDLGLDPGLAQAYADNDDLRLIKQTTEES